MTSSLRGEGGITQKMTYDDMGDVGWIPPEIDDVNYEQHLT